MAARKVGTQTKQKSTSLNSRIRTERNLMITCLAQYELEIFCGLKSGLLEVYDQNILLQNTLEGHKREVVGIDVSKDLLVSISKDMQVFTWSTRTKVKN